MTVRLTEEQIEHAAQFAADNLARSQEMTKRVARSEERKAVGSRVNPDTAEVFFVYAEVLDPYGDLQLEDDEHCVGREYFAVDPDEGVAVSFDDLPADTREALQEKQNAESARGWRSF